MPLVAWGLYTFSSGYNPQSIRGPDRESFLVEHQIPAREGGIIEYLGSRQPTYEFRGFISPPQDGAVNGVVGAWLSGTSYIGLNADDAKTNLLGLRVSGAALLKIESTNSNYSGYPALYENGFFYLDKVTFALEAGKAYPYYPYVLMFKGASTKTYGNSSGVTRASYTGSYVSGFIIGCQQASGLAKGEFVIGIGVQVGNVASGSMKVAVYNSGGTSLLTQSTGQAVNSGWNYFPLNPSFSTTSGVAYILCVKGNVSNSSGYSIIEDDYAFTSGITFLVSGQGYSADFPASIGIVVSGYVSGINMNIVLVTT